MVPRSLAGSPRCAMPSGCAWPGPGCPGARALWLLLSVAVLVHGPYCAAISPKSSPSSPSVDDDVTNTIDDDAVLPRGEEQFSDRFFQCYKDSRDSALSCLGESAEAGLSSFFSREHLHVSEGLSLVKETEEKDGDDAAKGRVLFHDEEPTINPNGQQHKSVIDSAASYLAARALRWDMSGLYPGLIMRVGPTLSGSGMLEFVLEPRRFYTDRQLGPSRMLLKQVILPFLLGVKVSVASLVPLLLFTVVFLAKKALLMSHLSALLSSFLGFGAYGYGHSFGPGLGGGLGPGPAGAGVGVGASSVLNNPLAPIRSSGQQAFPGDAGPQILNLGGAPPLGHSGVPVPSWLAPAHHPHHLFRGVNYDFRDERHSSGAEEDSVRTTRGFRWEDRDKHRNAVGPSSGMEAAGVVIRRGW